MIETREQMIESVTRDFPHTLSDPAALNDLANAWEWSRRAQERVDGIDAATNPDAWRTAVAESSKASKAYLAAAKRLGITPAQRAKRGL